MASKTAGRGRQKGTGTVFKKGNRFYFQTKTDGVRKTELLHNDDGTPCTTEAQATAAAARINKSKRDLDAIQDHKAAVEAIAKDRKLIASLTTTPADIWETFINSPTRPHDSSEARQRDQKRVIDRLVDWCGRQTPQITTMDGMTAEALAKFLNDTYGGLSGRSYCEAITIMRHVFKHTSKALGLDSNPAESLEGRALKTKSRKEFTPSQVQAILQGFDGGFFFDAEVVRMTTGRNHERVVKRLEYRPEYPRQFRTLILLMMFTGCRCGDACGMTWEAVNLATNTITFTPHKTAESSGVVVSLPLHPMLRAGLIEAREWKRDGHILPDVAARYENNPTGIYGTIKKIVKCATGLEVTAKDGEGRGAAQYGAHSFRHSFVSFCASAGVPLAVVQQIVGHGSPAMTEHYFNASRDAKQAAIEALPDIGAEVPQQPKDITADALRMKAHDLLDKLPIDAIREIINLYMTQKTE